MGRTSKNRKNREKEKVDPLSKGRPLPNPSHLNVLRQEKVLPVVRNLASLNPNERIQGIEAIAHLVEDEPCRKLLLKERVVLTVMEQTINDGSPEAVMWAWATLRNLAVEEGYDVCVHMYRKDIFTPIITTVKKLSNALGIPESMSVAQKRVLWACVENIFGLLTSLSETVPEAAELIAKSDIIRSIFALLDDPSAPRTLKSTVAILLNVLTEDNDKLAAEVISTPSAAFLLELRDEALSLFSSPIPSPQLLRASALCGVVHNLNSALKYLSNTENIKHDVFVSLSDSLTLSRLNNIIQYASQVIRTENVTNGTHTSKNREANEELSHDELLQALQIALEVIASIASSLQEEFEEAVPFSEYRGSISDENRMDVDEDGGSEGSDTEGGVPLEITEEMEMEATIDHHDDKNGGSKFCQEDSIVFQLLNTTMPLLIPLSAVSVPTSTYATLLGSAKTVQLGALNTLNNVSWVFSTHISPPSSLFSIWSQCIPDIWATVITPILASNTADVDFAEAVSGLAWAIARTAKGELDLGSNQHITFMALCQATASMATKEREDLQVKCVGVLGCLALPPGQVHINKEIGTFLIKILNALPDTPANTAVEALNAIYDVYADKGFDYDEEVFVKMGFLRHLEGLNAKVKEMVKKIDKRKEPELRGRADEAMANLGRFVQYKRKERS